MTRLTLDQKISLFFFLGLLVLCPLLLVALQLQTRTTSRAGNAVIAQTPNYPWGKTFYKTGAPVFEDTGVRDTVIKSLLTDIDDQTKQPLRYPHPTLGGNKYWLAYASIGGGGKIRYAYSDDLLAWKRFENNPILSFGPGELYLSSPHLFKKGDLYYLFYDVGTPDTRTPKNPSNETQRLSYASSPTPFGPWTKGAYILNAGAPGAWDYGRVTEPGIFKDGDTYYLFYMGDSSSGGSGEQVAVATTSAANFPNGPWVKQGIMLPIGQSATAWDRGLTADPNIIKVGNTFYMLYTGSYGNENWKMGIATASNLLGPWTRPTSPILSPGPATWDNGSLVRGGLYYNQSKFYLYYSGYGASTGRFKVGLAIGDPLLTPTPTPHACPNYERNCVNIGLACPAGAGEDPQGQCGVGFRCCNPNLTPIATNTPALIPTPSAATIIPTPTAVPSQQGAIMINTGGPAYTDKGGNKWLADFGFLGGQTYAVANNITGTTDQTLYRTERYGMPGYRFNVSNGTYSVTLKFAEIYAGCYYAGCRVFNIDIEGARVLAKFDIYAQAGGLYKALDKTFTVVVNDGQLNINFVPLTANTPKINAIKIVPI